MSTNIKDAKSVSSIAPMEAGTYAARCCGVIDLGLQKTSFEGVEKETMQILVIFEFPEETIEIDGEQKPRWMSNFYTLSVHEKSRLRKDLKSWRGKDFTEQELQDFDIANVLNAPCMVTIAQTSKNGVTYSNITGIGKLVKGMQVGELSKKLHFDMDSQDTWSCFAELPEWIQRKINDSLTLKNQGIQISKEGQVFNIGKQDDKQFLPVDDGLVDDEDLPF